MAVLCSNCSGKLIFNPASQKLDCVSCGSKFRPEDVEDKDARLHTKYYNTRVYTCSHCGAEVITSDSEASTFCVYCGNPAIVFSRISEEYMPDGLIPFKVTKEEAIRNISANFMKNPFVPQEIKSKVTADNLRGIYVPYWIINAEYTEADLISGDVKRGKTTYREHFSRAGDVELQNVPIDGSRMLNDDVSRKLEPFYLEDSTAFDEDYLNGFYSNTSDLSYFDLKKSAAGRCHKLFSDEVLKTVKAKNKKIDNSIQWIDIEDDPLYMMMPVWFFTFRHGNKPYTILVNGQTGKVVGTLPWNTKRIWAIAAGIFIPVALFSLLPLIPAFSRNINLLRPVFTYGFSALFVLGGVGIAKGIAGIKRILMNLKLTQSEDIFKYVKKRQG